MGMRLLVGGFFLAAFALGCQRSAVEQAEVSGRVLFKGKPLPGGLVTFATDRGFTASSRISEEGLYQLNAPVGEVQISVDNLMLARPVQAPRREGKPPDVKEPEPDPIRGTYVPLPRKYSILDQSGLKYTVTKGRQSHNIELE
jgi:hypothetical protein